MPKAQKRANKAFKSFLKELDTIVTCWPKEARAWLDVCYELPSHKN